MLALGELLDAEPSNPWSLPGHTLCQGSHTYDPTRAHTHAHTHTHTHTHTHVHTPVPGSTYFSFTVMTTIGYGNFAPSTSAGKALVVRRVTSRPARTHTTNATRTHTR